MKKFILIPANFDAQKLINDRLAQFQTPHGITVQNLNYLCHCIISRQVNIKDGYLHKDGNNGYVQLKAEYLRRFVREYKNCLRFLEDNIVIICDHKRVIGAKCFGYKLHWKYMGTGFTELKLKGAQLRSLIKYEAENLSPEIKRLHKTRQFLKDFILSDKLLIDAEAAKREIDTVYAEKCQELSTVTSRQIDRLLIQMENAPEPNRIALNNQIKRNRQQLTEKLKILGFNMNKHKTLVDQVNNKNFEIKIDESGRRLHTPLTRMPKYLRKHLWASGQRLVSLDLKNSQPYLSLLLFKKEVFQRARGSRGNLTINKLDNELFQLINSNKPSLLCTKSSETPVNTTFSEVRNYQKDVLSGNLYDRFVDTGKDNEALFYAKRNRVKKNFLLALYNVPKPSKRTIKFYKAYPDELGFFNQIKSVKVGRLRRKKLYSKQSRRLLYLENSSTTPQNKYNPHTGYEFIDKGYTKLACLLQRIESRLLLDVICKRINKENPIIPLITIHDSIATTNEHVEYVEAIMIDELEKAIGFPPKLELEHWCYSTFPKFNQTLDRY